MSKHFSLAKVEAAENPNRWNTCVFGEDWGAYHAL